MTTLDRTPVLDFVVDDEGLSGLRTEWDELLSDAQGASVFMTHAWVSAWSATLRGSDRLLVGVARDPRDGRLMGLAPFSVGTLGAGPFRAGVLRMAGAGPACPDHLDLVVRHGHPHVAGALWQAVASRRTWDLVDLDGLRPRSHLAGEVLRRRGDRAAHATATVCPVLDLPGTWEEYEASLGRNLRQNLGRYGRKLDREAGGPVTERLVVDPAGVAATVEEMARLHQEVRTGRGDRGSFADRRMVDFHRRVALAFLESGRLRLHRLDVAGRLVAAISCFRYGGTVAFYTTGYDPAYASYGPGRRIMASAIRSAIAEGADRFDFLRGDEAYKRSWGARDAWDERIRFPAGARGRVLAQAMALRRAGRTLLTRPGRPPSP